MDEDFSEEHCPRQSLNAEAWTISCTRSDVAPLEDHSLPKYALEALYDAGRVPDPLVGKNEEALRWVAEETWSFQCTFDLAEEVGRESMALRELVLEGVYAVATVVLNGKHIADLQNAHRQHRIDVIQALKKTGNTLVIAIKPAAAEAKRRMEAYPYSVPCVQA